MVKIFQIVSLISSAIFLLIFCSSKPSHKPEKEQSSAHNPDKQQETKECETFWQRIKRDPIALSTFGLVIATSILALVAILQIILLCKSISISEISAKAAKKSAETSEKTLITTHRPWISVHPKIGSELKFNDKGGEITIEFNIKNVGDSPAIGVWLKAKIFLQTPQRNMLREKTKICNVIKEKPSIIGYTLFPNEMFVHNRIFLISKDKIKQSYRDFAKTAKDAPPVNSILPVIVGCVKYKFPIDQSIHRTDFIVNIHRRDPNKPNSWFVIYPTSGTLPRNMISLDINFIGSYAD